MWYRNKILLKLKNKKYQKGNEHKKKWNQLKSKSGISIEQKIEKLTLFTQIRKKNDSVLVTKNLQKKYSKMMMIN